MRNHRELRSFLLADELALTVYRVTRSFPADERFGLVSQTRRAAVSVASNIVEGCTRDSQADFARFVEIALGSCSELAYQLGLAKRLDFPCSADDFAALEACIGQAEACVRNLSALLKAVRARYLKPVSKDTKDPA